MSLIRTVCETTLMYANRPRSCQRNDLDVCKSTCMRINLYANRLVCKSTCMRNDRHPHGHVQVVKSQQLRVPTFDVNHSLTIELLTVFAVRITSMPDFHYITKIFEASFQ